MTRADGAFDLWVGENKEPYNIVVGSEDAFAFRTHVAPGTQDLTLQLRPGGVLRVRVRGTDGQLKAGVSVQGPVGIDGAQFLELSGVSTGLDGVAELAVPAGLIDVVLRRSSDGRTLAHVQAQVRERGTVDADAVIGGEPPKDH
jgi:hypothetical protein